MEGQLGERSGAGGDYLVWTGGVMTRRLQFEELGQRQSERQAEEKSVFEYISAGGGWSRKMIEEETETNIRSFSFLWPLHPSSYDCSGSRRTQQLSGTGTAATTHTFPQTVSVHQDLLEKRNFTISIIFFILFTIASG